MNLTFILCRTSALSKFGRYAALCFYPSLSLVLLSAPILIVVDILSNNNLTIMQLIVLLVASTCALLLSLFLFKISKKCFQMENRQIALDQFGFTIRDCEDRRYAWKQVCCIGILAYAANASKQNYQTEICIFLEPPDHIYLKKLRDSYLYGAFNLDRFVLMDFTPSLVDELTRYSSLPIIDYRSEQMRI